MGWSLVSVVKVGGIRILHLINLDLLSSWDIAWWHPTQPCPALDSRSSQSEIIGRGKCDGRHGQPLLAKDTDFLGKSHLMKKLYLYSGLFSHMAEADSTHRKLTSATKNDIWRKISIRYSPQLSYITTILKIILWSESLWKYEVSNRSSTEEQYRVLLR